MLITNKENTMHYVTVDTPRDYPLTDEFLSDILTGATEGGIGYWASYETGCNEEGYVTSISDIIDAETGEAFPGLEGEPGLVAFRHLVGAIRQVLNYETVLYPTRSVARLLNCVIANDASDLDVEDCDELVQVALFGEVIYG